MTTTLDYEQVTEFATAVRRELSDLGPDILDDLTDGLEADLADKLDDGQPLGDPAGYAAELRDASGIDPRARAGWHLDAALRSAVDDLRSEFTGFIGRHAWAAGVISFLVSLRPVWWVLRAWAVFYVITSTGYPRNEVGFLTLAALVVLSVQWGRGRWLPWRWARGALVVVSIIAAFVVPAAASSLFYAVQFEENFVPEDFMSSGLTADGRTVTNIFAYGPDGKPLSGVQLFDQNGDPLEVVSPQWGTTNLYDETLGDSALLVPSDEVAGRPGWNVYPLQSVPSDSIDFDNGEVNSWAKRSDVTGPFAAVQPLLGYEAPADDDE
jgi:hypothetical protein